MPLLTVPNVPLLDRWARVSQRDACRNARVATSELNRRRLERDEVEAYLASVAPRPRNRTAVVGAR